FGRQALALNLIDEISTSDDLLLKAFENKQVIEVRRRESRPQTRQESIGNG
ncbi:protease SohB, partial [Neisseria meningitidis]|nr:protease SohB [Neisseria meningitidis]